MLGVLFPPRVMAELVGNAAKKTGQVRGLRAGGCEGPPAGQHEGRAEAARCAAEQHPSLRSSPPHRPQTDLADVLRTAAAHGSSSADSWRADSSLAGGQSAPSSVRSSLEALHAPMPAAGTEGVQAPRSEVAGPLVSIDASPFAAAAARRALSGAGSPAPPPPGALSPSTAAALIRQASHGGSVAEAMLRQVRGHCCRRRAAPAPLATALPHHPPPLPSLCVPQMSSLSIPLDLDVDMGPVSPHNWEGAWATPLRMGAGQACMP